MRNSGGDRCEVPICPTCVRRCAGMHRLSRYQAPAWASSRNRFHLISGMKRLPARPYAGPVCGPPSAPSRTALRNSSCPAWNLVNKRSTWALYPFSLLLCAFSFPVFFRLSRWAWPFVLPLTAAGRPCLFVLLVPLLAAPSAPWVLLRRAPWQQRLRGAGPLGAAALPQDRLGQRPGPARLLWGARAGRTLGGPPDSGERTARAWSIRFSRCSTRRGARPEWRWCGRTGRRRNCPGVAGPGVARGPGRGVRADPRFGRCAGAGRWPFGIGARRGWRSSGRGGRHLFGRGLIACVHRL